MRYLLKKDQQGKIVLEIVMDCDNSMHAFEIIKAVEQQIKGNTYSLLSSEEAAIIPHLKLGLLHAVKFHRDLNPNSDLKASKKYCEDVRDKLMNMGIL